MKKIRMTEKINKLCEGMYKDTSDMSEDEKREILDIVMNQISDYVFKKIVYKTVPDADKDMVEGFVKDCPDAHPFKYSSFRDWCKSLGFSDALAAKKYADIAKKILGSPYSSFAVFPDMTTSAF